VHLGHDILVIVIPVQSDGHQFYWHVLQTRPHYLILSWKSVNWSNKKIWRLCRKEKHTVKLHTVSSLFFFLAITSTVFRSCSIILGRNNQWKKGCLGHTLHIICHYKIYTVKPPEKLHKLIENLFSLIFLFYITESRFSVNTLKLIIYFHARIEEINSEQYYGSLLYTTCCCVISLVSIKSSHKS
jgi:hypothetical protein